MYLNQDIESQRYGVRYDHQWNNIFGSYHPVSLVSDIRYVSDDLFLREMGDFDFGNQEDRFLPSTVQLRTVLSDSVFATLSGDYTQATQSDDDLVLQRLPELSVNGYQSFRPFGSNKYGLKLITKEDLLGTYFDRDRGYDGLRLDFVPRAEVPFHVSNYVNGSIYGALRYTTYDLDQTQSPSSEQEFEDSEDRGIYEVGGELNSSVERIFDLKSDGFIRTLTGLGKRSQTEEIKRVKHTVETFC